MGTSRTETVVMPDTMAQSSDDEERSPVLVVVSGAEVGRRYLLNQGRLVLGRDAVRSDLPVSDPTVSGCHAELRVDSRSGRYEVVDLSSRNGTFVNGHRVNSRSLRDGDRIHMGSTLLEFTFHGTVEGRYHQELERMMHEDSLTGLFARGWFDREYPREFDRARRDGRPFCVLMMDMDGLKAINDKHGHLLGSHCVAETGALIKAGVGATGCAARFGGDEFIAFVRDATIGDGLDVAEAIRRSVERHEFRKDRLRVRPTISIGVAELDETVRSPEELIRLADAALYRAKKAGRNSVCG